MGVFKRYKNAQAAQKDAENAMPGAYQSNYTDRINEALDSMGAASNAGYDVGTDSELYRQYRAGAQANARAAAENAAAGAAALSGGFRCAGLQTGMKVLEDCRSEDRHTFPSPILTPAFKVMMDAGRCLPGWEERA